MLLVLSASWSLVTSLPIKVMHVEWVCLPLLFLDSEPTFDSIESAKRAKDALNGADIYSGCCTLKIEFAKVSTHILTRVILPESIDGSTWHPKIHGLSLDPFNIVGYPLKIRHNRGVCVLSCIVVANKMCGIFSMLWFVQFWNVLENAKRLT